MARHGHSTLLQTLPGAAFDLVVDYVGRSEKKQIVVDYVGCSEK